MEVLTPQTSGPSSNQIHTVYQYPSGVNGLGDFGGKAVVTKTVKKRRKVTTTVTDTLYVHTSDPQTFENLPINSFNDLNSSGDLLAWYYNTSGTGGDYGAGRLVHADLGYFVIRDLLDPNDPDKALFWGPYPVADCMTDRIMPDSSFPVLYGDFRRYDNYPTNSGSYQAWGFVLTPFPVSE